jgi:hypothetical protein
MEPTQHIGKRMAQRGISRQLVDLVMEHGTPENDKVVLGKKELRERLEALDSERRLLMKAIDKGGLVVVADNGKLITTYRCESRGNH